jgi:hypothetical protein
MLTILSQQERFQTAPEDCLRLWPVSKRVNRTGNVHDSTLIEEVSLDAA